MNAVNKALLIFALLLGANLVFAECNKIACTGVGNEVLMSVYPNSSGHIFLQPAGNVSELDCVLQEGHYMVLQNDHPRFSEVYATVLTALMGGKTLTVRIKNGSKNCEVSYVRMFM